MKTLYLIESDERNLEECARSCAELHERLKLVVHAHSKEQVTNEFDSIAIYDKADRRAADIIKILMVRVEGKFLLLSKFCFAVLYRITPKCFLYM